MATFYVKSGAGAVDFINAHTWVLHNKIVPAVADVSSNVAVGKQWVWECTTAGTTNGAITWPASATQDVTTVTQNSVVFTARKPGFSSGTTADWTFAAIYLRYLGTAVAAGDTVYVSNNHSESFGTSNVTTVITAACNVLCVDDSAAPPTTLATGGTIATTTSITLTITAGPAYWYGIFFQTVSGVLTANQSVYEKCRFTCGSSSAITPNGLFINCDIKFNATNASVFSTGVVWRGGTLIAGSTPASFYVPNGTNAAANVCAALFEGFDFSAVAATINLGAGTSAGQGVHFRNCQLPAAWSGSLNASTPGALSVFELSNTDVAGTSYVIQRKAQFGTLTQETTIVRSSGASDGVTPIAWKLVSTSGAGFFPAGFVETPEIVVRNAQTGSPITVTVELVSSASLNDDEIWLEVQYLGTAGAPISTLITSAKAGVFAVAAAVPTSTATWASSPATPVYQKMSVTFTPRLNGFIHATVKLCKATKTVYVDPVLTITGGAQSAQYQVPGGPYVNQVASMNKSRIFTGM